MFGGLKDILLSSIVLFLRNSKGKACIDTQKTYVRMENKNDTEIIHTKTGRR
jgi:hypothetical protein